MRERCAQHHAPSHVVQHVFCSASSFPFRFAASIRLTTMIGIHVSGEASSNSRADVQSQSGQCRGDDSRVICALSDRKDAFFIPFVRAVSPRTSDESERRRKERLAPLLLQVTELIKMSRIRQIPMTVVSGVKTNTCPVFLSLVLLFSCLLLQS